MANSFDVSNWLSMTALALLEDERSVSKFFNTDYNKEFKQHGPVGDSIRIPYPAQFRTRNGLQYDPTDVTRRSTTITFDDPFGVDFEWDSVEEALYTPRGREKVEREIIKPAMAHLAQEIDSRCALYAYQNAASVVGVLGTNPTTFDATSAAARQVMRELACPAGDEKGMIVPPVVHRSVKGSNLTLFNDRVEVSKMYRQGIVGHADGFDWYESMSLYRHTAGNWQTPASVTVNTAPASGSSTLVVNCTTGDTFKKGDKISIAAVLPVHPATRRTFGTSAKTVTITADATGVSSLATLSISPALYGPTSVYQNVNALPVASALLTLWPGTASPSGKVGQVGLALHPDAFGLVSAELEMPKASSVEMASQKRDPDSGISIRFIRQFDGRASKMINRFDVMLGYGTFFNDACAVAVACG